MFFASGEDNREIWSKDNMSILTLDDNTNKDTYCCLGVACRIIHPRKDFKGAGTLSSYDTKSIKIPDILKGDNSKKSHDYNPVVDKLINMNDMLDKNFNQIANWIEKNL